MAVTLKDIADRLNVSVATVSCALRGEKAGRYPLAHSTVELVRRTAKEMGYRRNLVASSLQQRRTRVIGVLLPEIESDYYRRIFRGILSELDKDILPLVALHNYAPDLELRFLDMMIGKRIDALIAGCSGAAESVTTYKELFDTYGIPTCLIDRGLPGYDEVPVIRPNAREGGRIGVDALYRLGHRQRILYGSYNDGLDSVYELYEGVSARCREYGIDLEYCHTSVERRQNDSKTELSIFADRIISVWKEFRASAILVNTDLVAYELLRRAPENKIAIPQEVSVMGMDDGAPSSLPGVNLSTISARIEEIGRESVAILREPEEIPSGTVAIDLSYTPQLRGTTKSVERAD